MREIYVSADKRQQNDFGSVMDALRSIPEDDHEPVTIYLGRPWRDYAKTVFIDCRFDAHIHPALFHDWGKENARKTVFYGVGRCRKESGGGFSEKDDFVRELEEEEFSAFSKEKVLSGADGWRGDFA